MPVGYRLPFFCSNYGFLPFVPRVGYPRLGLQPGLARRQGNSR